MMIELMAGKSAAIHGLVHDATPFRFSEENTAIDYFGRLLEEGKFSKPVKSQTLVLTHVSVCSRVQLLRYGTDVQWC